jgi:ABC-2 type transport system ATP-binding protein
MESVEELCSHIAILNLSEKMLEGKVSDIRKKYSKNCFEIAYNNAESIDLNGSSAFQCIGNANVKEGKFVQEIQLNAGFQINDAITFLMPKIQFNGIKEIIPSINEIFIDQIKNA